MRPHVVMVTLLLVATVLVDLVICGFANESSLPWMTLTSALWLGQVNLLSLWLGLGTTYWLLRVLALAAGIAVLAGMLGAVTSLDFRSAATMVGSDAGVVCLLAGAGRLTGFRWTLIAADSATTNGAAAGPPQFSLARLFGWTTVAAVVAALASKASFRDFVVDELLAHFITIGIVTLVTGYIISTSRRKFIGLALVVLIATEAAMLLSVIISDAEVVGYMLALYILHALFVAGWFGACRLVGIRIVRYRRAGPAEARAASSP